MAPGMLGQVAFRVAVAVYAAGLVLWLLSQLLIGPLMGAGPLRIFWHVALPLARRGIVSGLLLAFARALGEFGATVMIFGDLSGNQTLPIFVYSDYTSGRSLESPWLTWLAISALSGVSLLVILLYNRSNALSQE